MRHLKPARRANRRGFTLIELTVVVALIAIATTLGIKMLGAQLENTAQQSTRAKMQAIREALISYYAKYQRLPCPDTAPGFDGAGLGFNAANPPDGRENRQFTIGAPPTDPDVSQGCAANSVSASGFITAGWGVLPYVDLGLSRDAAIDGWGNFFNYVLTVAPGANFGPGVAYSGWHITRAPSDTSRGQIRVLGDGGAALTLPNNDAVVVVISRGPNGLGATSANGTVQVAPTSAAELVNDAPHAVGPPHAVIARPASEVAGALGPPIDDIVVYLTPADLIGPSVRSGQLQSGDVAARQLVAQARTALIGYMAKMINTPGATQCQLPIAAGSAKSLLVAAPALGSIGIGLDPWGQQLFIEQSNLPPTPAAPTPDFLRRPGSAQPYSTTQLRIYSVGPNGIDDNGAFDDIVTSISGSEIYGSLFPDVKNIVDTVCPL